MNLRCLVFGHSTGAPQIVAKDDGRTVLAVKCSECSFVSDGVEVAPPRQVTDRWNPNANANYWNSARGRAWLNGGLYAA